MANVSVYNMEGKEVGTIELNDAVFGVEVNEHLVHMAVVQQLANNRQGTQKAKTRSEVSGGGRKPWRQKGTGHARQGSTRSPQWAGGGVVFAPVPRDYSFKLNKKEKRAALKSALTSKVQGSSLIVVDELKFDEIKTKNFTNVMNNLTILNPDKLLEYVAKAIDHLQNILHKRFKNRTCFGLYVHICCLVERLVTRQAISNFTDQDFKEKHQEFIDQVNISMKEVKTYYNVEIPDEEIEYIYNYIIND